MCVCVPECTFKTEGEREKKKNQQNTLLAVKVYRSEKKNTGNVRKIFLVSTGTAVN